MRTPHLFASLAVLLLVVSPALAQSRPPPRMTPTFNQVARPRPAPITPRFNQAANPRPSNPGTARPPASPPSTTPTPPWRPTWVPPGY